MPKQEVWTIKQVLDWCENYLRAKGDKNPKLSAQWLVSDATSLARVELFMNFDKPLSANEKAHLRETLKRRGAGEPLQYISGEAAFRHIVIKADRGVLIPRPETEMLVELVLDWIGEHHTSFEQKSEQKLSPQEDLQREGLGQENLEQERPPQESPQQECLQQECSSQKCPPQEDLPQEETLRQNRPQVLEIGTGSGCIACSLAKEAGAHVLATDISPVAVKCAQNNVELLKLDDLVEVVETDCADNIDGTFDVLVSNPPYIPHAEMQSLSYEVAGFEPHVALDGGADGLEFFRRLINIAPTLLKTGCLFACELHETTLEQAALLLEQAGFKNVQITNDLAGKQRFISAIFES